VKYTGTFSSSSSFPCPNPNSATKPSGYVELAELGIDLYSDDNTVHPDLQHHFSHMISACAKLGRLQVRGEGETLRERLESAGFVDVHVVNVKQPYGPWPKDERMKHIGAMVMMMCETGVEAYGMALFTRVLGMDTEEARTVCRAAVKAVRNKNFHMYSYL
jgi:hypothetical protein